MAVDATRWVGRWLDRWVDRRLDWRAAASWGGFFGLILISWALLFQMAAAQTPAAGTPSWLLDTLCGDGAAAGQVSLAALIAMWCLMATAMMAPSALPVLRTYRDITLGMPAKVPALGFPALLAGFLTVWGVFSIFGAVAQQTLSQAGLLTAGGVLTSQSIAALLLLLAGLYQFGPVKRACLNRCKSPMTFFMSHWRDGLAGAYGMGLRQGVYCVGCCGALMALAFVGGTMNLIWMGIGMVLMTLEKLPALDRYLTWPIGVLLIGAGLWMAFGPAAGT